MNKSLLHGNFLWFETELIFVCVLGAEGEDDPLREGGGKHMIMPNFVPDGPEGVNSFHGQ